MSQKVRLLPLTLLALALLSGGMFIRGCAQANAQTLSNPESVELDPARKDLCGARSSGKIYTPSTSTSTEHPTECLLGAGFDA